VRSIFLLDQVFEDADVVILRNFDSEHLLSVVAKNEAVEREEVGWINLVDYL
jgi:hypothetical protein